MKVALVKAEKHAQVNTSNCWDFVNSALHRQSYFSVAKRLVHYDEILLLKAA